MKSDVIAFLDRWFTRQKLRNPLRGPMRREVDKGVDFTMIESRERLFLAPGDEVSLPRRGGGDYEDRKGCQDL